MNLILRCPNNGCYYLYSVRMNPDGSFASRMDKMSPKGEREDGWRVNRTSERSAKEHCRSVAKNKVRMGRCEVVAPEGVPEFMGKWMAPESDNRMTAQEMLEMVRSSFRELYVVLSDVEGVEKFFDAGVQYVGHETVDADFVEVMDRFGEPRSVRRDRILSVEPTERAVEVMGLKKVVLENKV